MLLEISDFLVYYLMFFATFILIPVIFVCAKITYQLIAHRSREMLFTTTSDFLRTNGVYVGEIIQNTTNLMSRAENHCYQYYCTSALLDFGENIAQMISTFYIQSQREKNRQCECKCNCQCGPNCSTRLIRPMNPIQPDLNIRIPDFGNIRLPTIPTEPAPPAPPTESKVFSDQWAFDVIKYCVKELELEKEFDISAEDLIKFATEGDVSKLPNFIRAFTKLTTRKTASTFNQTDLIDRIQRQSQQCHDQNSQTNSTGGNENQTSSEEPTPVEV